MSLKEEKLNKWFNRIEKTVIILIGVALVALIAMAIRINLTKFKPPVKKVSIPITNPVMKDFVQQMVTAGSGNSSTVVEGASSRPISSTTRVRSRMTGKGINVASPVK